MVSNDEEKGPMKRKHEDTAKDTSTTKPKKEEPKKQRKTIAQSQLEKANKKKLPTITSFFTKK
jgi:hypothetical protein